MAIKSHVILNAQRIKGYICSNINHKIFLHHRKLEQSIFGNNFKVVWHSEWHLEPYWIWVGNNDLYKRLKIAPSLHLMPYFGNVVKDLRSFCQRFIIRWCVIVNHYSVCLQSFLVPVLNKEDTLKLENISIDQFHVHMALYFLTWIYEIIVNDQKRSVNIQEESISTSQFPPLTYSPPASTPTPRRN